MLHLENHKSLWIQVRGLRERMLHKFLYMLLNDSKKSKDNLKA